MPCCRRACFRFAVLLPSIRRWTHLGTSAAPSQCSKEKTMTVLANPKISTQPAPPDVAPASNGPEGRDWFRAFLLRLHFYAGILAGPFLLVAAVSGGLYAITPQLEQAVYSKELHVPAVTRPLPLAAQVKAAMDFTGGGTPASVRPAPGPEDTTRVLFADPSL